MPDILGYLFIVALALWVALIVFSFVYAYLVNSPPRFLIFAKSLYNSDFKIKKTPEGDVVVEKYAGTSQDVVVPRHVTVIAAGAFSGNINLQSVNFPKSLKRIETGAFLGCVSLERVYFPEGLEAIEYGAFPQSPIRDVYLPASLKQFDPGAIQGCSWISVAEENHHYKSQDGVLFTRDMSTLVSFPGKYRSSVYRIPDSVTEISKEAFMGVSSLKLLKLPNGLKRIGDYAFVGCHLTKLTIPASVEKIGVGAFTRTEEIVVAEQNPWYASRDGVLFTKDMKTLVSYPGARNEIEYEVPESVERVEDQAFYYVTTIQRVILPNVSVVMGERVFYGCKDQMIVSAPLKLAKSVETDSPSQSQSRPEINQTKDEKPIQEKTTNFGPLKVSQDGKLVQSIDFGNSR